MSDMKCPFCGDEMKLTSLYMDGNHRYSHKYIGALVGGKDRCPVDGETLPLRALQEIHRTRKALELAKDALKEQQRWFGVIRVSLISHLNNEYGTAFKSYDADPTVVNVKKANNILNTALEQITALEQKDVK